MLQPELCEAELSIQDKYDTIGDDPRRRSEALQSFMHFQTKNSKTDYSQMVDVYAYGLVLYEVTAMM